MLKRHVPLAALALSHTSIVALSVPLVSIITPHNFAAVADIAMVMLYAKFTEGKFNPDVLLLLAEPIMYVIMAIGEEANIKYNIEDSNDLDEFDEEDNEEEIEGKINEFKTVFEDIKNGTIKKGIEPSKIQKGVVPQNILDKVKEQGPEIRSLLSKGEE